MKKFPLVSLMERERGPGIFLAVANILILGIGFFLLAFLQVSFLPHFAWRTLIFPLVPAALFLIIFLQKHNPAASLWAALWGGFFLDVFSHYPFGFWILLFLLARLAVSFIMNSYVRLPL